MKKYILLVAVSVFLFYCTNTDRDNPNDMWGSNYIEKSSAEGSSSSVEAGEPSSSSGNEELSSSSAEPSSSSVEPSSSSVAPSSSSVTLPSSSSEDLCANFVEGTTRLHYGEDKNQFCDERDGKKYVYVKIDEQTWMAENLNYNAAKSKCYEYDDEENCVTYGRLYDWVTAMNNSKSAKHRPNTQAGHSNLWQLR